MGVQEVQKNLGLVNLISIKYSAISDEILFLFFFNLQFSPAHYTIL